MLKPALLLSKLVVHCKVTLVPLRLPLKFISETGNDPATGQLMVTVASSNILSPAVAKLLSGPLSVNRYVNVNCVTAVLLRLMVKVPLLFTITVPFTGCVNADHCKLL